jgi:ribosomal 30S subunit maturation factor RimM
LKDETWSAYDEFYWKDILQCPIQEAHPERIRQVRNALAYTQIATLLRHILTVDQQVALFGNNRLNDTQDKK